MRVLRMLAVMLPLVLASVVVSALVDMAAPGSRVLDPFLLVTVWYAAHGRKTDGLLAGTVAGLVEDAAQSVILGTNYVAKVAVGYVSMLVAGQLIPGQPTTHAVLLAVGAVTEMATLAGLGALFGRDLVNLSPLNAVLTVAVNVGVGVAVFALIERARRRRERMMPHGPRGR